MDPKCAVETPLSLLLDQVRRSAVVEAPPPRPSADGDDAGEMEIWSINLVYGELQPDAVSQLFEKALAALIPDRRRGANPRPLPSFLDLGSGEGVPCLTAALCFNRQFGRICGIELLPRLHRVALGHRKALLKLLNDGTGIVDSIVPDADRMQAALDSIARVELICGSFLAEPAAVSGPPGGVSSTGPPVGIMPVSNSEPAAQAGPGPSGLSISDSLGSKASESPLALLPQTSMSVPVVTSLASGAGMAQREDADPCSAWPGLFDIVLCNGTW